jgi:DUF1680 family protein
VKRAFLVLLAIILCVQAYGIAQTKNPAQLSEDRIVKVRPLPLNSVRLTGGPLKHAQDLDAKYLLELEPDRMLAYLRERAGLKPKAAAYGGWDGSGRQLTGHIAGHYLSAVSIAWEATGDPRFKQRAEYIVNELKEIQQAQGDGYLGALMDGNGVDGKVRFQDLSKGVIKSGGFDLNGLWSPWYVEHKLFAGLRDAYRLTGNRTALDVEIKFAAWAEGILSKLSDEQIQSMLNTEFGGMNEVAADLYADTGDKRWLALSDKFQHRAVVDPLAAKQDILPGKHANTQIPKLYGSLMRYVYTGNQTDRDAAMFFWDRVAKHHSFATGGNSKNEYFGNPDLMNDFVDGRTAETCNVYNMIKMARTLFSIEPDIRYADYHERALFNQILASQDPQDGRVSYMVPVGRGVQHEYQDKYEDFTCCVGSAMESHALHSYGIYYESGDKLWVSLYAPTTADWKAASVKLEMSTDFPIGESASLKVNPKSPKAFTLALRRPYWAGEGFIVKVNGQPLKSVPKPDSYVEITRTWKAGDTVELTLPKTLRKEPLADNPNRLALMWGPLALAGDLGKEFNWQEWEKLGSKPSVDVPVLVTPEQPIENWLKPVAGKPGAFRTVGVGTPNDVDFVPFYQLPRRKYAIYFDVFTPEQWKQNSAAYAAAEEKKKKLEAATVAFAQPGQMQSERDFAQQGEDSTPVQLEGRYGRQATKWFSFDLPVDTAHPMSLIVTYANETRRKATFSVVVDGQKLGELTVDRRSPELDVRFIDAEFPLPAELVQQKKKVTVRLEATNGTSIPGVFGIRTVRADVAR